MIQADEIQERLIKNKTLLNVVEPTLENTPLEVLLGKHKKVQFPTPLTFLVLATKHTLVTTVLSQVAAVWASQAQCHLLTLNTHF